MWAVVLLLSETRVIINDMGAILQGVMLQIMYAEVFRVNWLNNLSLRFNTENRGMNIKYIWTRAVGMQKHRTMEYTQGLGIFKWCTFTSFHNVDQKDIFTKIRFDYFMQHLQIFKNPNFACKIVARYTMLWVRNLLMTGRTRYKTMW